MHSRVWRFFVVTGVAAGLLRLLFHHPVATMLAVPVAAAYVLVLVRVWHWTFNAGSTGPHPPPPSARTIWVATLAGGGAVGLAHLDVRLGLTALAVATLTSPWLVNRWRRDGRRIAVPDPAAPAGPSAQLTPSNPAAASDDVRSHLDRVLADLDDSELCNRWQKSFLELRFTEPDRRWRVVELRAAYLDEMTRRHPRAVSTWLAEGGRAWASPKAYFEDSA